MLLLGQGGIIIDSDTAYITDCLRQLFRYGL